MPQAGAELTMEVPRLDGGYNVKESPANLAVNDSPDCLNVKFNLQGAVETRFGCSVLNTSPIATAAIDGLAAYNGSMVAWCNGSMYRLSGTTFVTIASAQSQFTPGAKVAWAVYQGKLFCSDGTNGPFRYEGPSDFYRMGIATPSAPTGASNSATGTGAGPETGTYYYAVSYVNSASVEGERGSNSVAVVNTTTSVVNVSSIPIAAASLGVMSKRIYRASAASGPFRMVGSIAAATGVYTDTVGAATWAVQNLDVVDASPPPAFSTIKLHQEHLWMPDSDSYGNKSLLRYTNYRNPYISEAENFFPYNEGDNEDILAIGVQDSYVSSFKHNSTWILDLVSPGFPETYSPAKSPSNVGIIGPRAFVETNNGIIFMGRRNNQITGIHLLAGAQVMQTSDSKLRTESISQRLERDILALPKASWANLAMGTYNNQIYIAYTKTGDSQNAHGWWFDVNRTGDEGQPGSWAPWDGRATQVSCYLAHTDGNLYAGSSLADGSILRLEVTDSYSDAGAAINSYWWSKQLGGESSVESWWKDWRKLNLWFAQLGNYNMRVKYRKDGDTGDGSTQDITLNAGGPVFDTALFDSSYFGGSSDTDQQLNLGAFLSRRISFGFSNLNTINQGFRVYKFSTIGTLRRSR